MANFRRERLPGVIPDDAGGRNFYGLSAFPRCSSGSNVGSDAPGLVVREEVRRRATV
jgi:hypothetical protein